MIIDYHDNWEIVLVKKKMYKYNLGLKNHLLTLDDYLLSCGDSGGGGSGDNSERVSGDNSGVGLERVGGSSGSIVGGRVGGNSGSSSNYGGSGGGRVGGYNGGDGGSGNSSGCRCLWLLFIVVDILFYYSRYIILL